MPIENKELIAYIRNKTDQRHIEMVMKKNERIAKLEMIKEHFHKIFDQEDELSAQDVSATAMRMEESGWSVQTKGVIEIASRQ